MADIDRSAAARGGRPTNYLSASREIKRPQEFTAGLPKAITRDFVLKRRQRPVCLHFVEVGEERRAGAVGSLSATNVTV